jgi:hypothetical protein
MTQLAATLDHASKYIALGWGLCSIPPGTKGPTDPGWNSPGNIIKTPWQATATIGARPAYGLDLVHSVSGTCAIDVDHLECFQACLAELGTDVAALFAGAPRIISKEGRDIAYDMAVGRMGHKNRVCVALAKAVTVDWSRLARRNRAHIAVVPGGRIAS